MMKKPYKVMALSTLIATIAAGGIMPSYASAAENTTKPAPIYADAANNYPEYSKYSLGPDGLKDAMTQTGSNMLVMDLYALTILKQSNLNFDGLTVITDDLKTSLNQKLGVSRENATQWLDDLKPQIIKINQNVINYDTKFQTYYADLLKDTNTALENAKNNNNKVNDQDKELIKTSLANLNKDISKNTKAVDKLVTNLKAFRGKLEQDTQGLKADADQITSTLTSQESGIPLLQQQIESNQKSIDDNNRNQILSGFAIAAGPFVMATPFFFLGIPMIVGGIYGTVVTKQQIEQAQKEIIELTGTLSSMKLQVAKLTVLKNNTKNLTDTIDLAITASENIKKQWTTIGTKYSSLLENIDDIDPDSLTTIITDLKIAQKSWNDVKNTAENIQNSEISLVEEKK